MTRESIAATLHQPLAELIRPTTINQYIGQRHLFDNNNSNGRVSSFIRLGYLPSLLFYGPPGVGKTTIASVVAKEAKYVFVQLSATNTTVTQLRDLRVAITDENRKRYRLDRPALRVVVFVDEIHRFSKTQQDLLLPYIEAGDFTFIGATTALSHIAPAIVSRCQCIELEQLTEADLHQIIERAILFENVRRRITNKYGSLQYDSESIDAIAAYGDGDARKCINSVELVSSFLRGPSFEGVSSTHIVHSTDVSNLLKEAANVHSNEGAKDTTALLYDNLTHCLLQRPPRHKLRQDTHTELSNKIKETQQLQFEIKLLDDAQNNNDDHSSVVPPLTESTIFNDFKQSTISIDEKGTSEMFAAQMQVSDDSDLDSFDLPFNRDDHDGDSEGDFKRVEYGRLTKSEYYIIVANLCVQKLIEQHETVSAILRFLILFDSRYVDVQESKLVSLMSAERLLHKADVDTNILLTNAIQLLLFAKKSSMQWEADPRVQVSSLERYWKALLKDRDNSTDAQLEAHFEILTSPDWTTVLQQNIQELEQLLKQKDEEYALEFEIKQDPLFEEHEDEDDDDDEQRYIERCLNLAR